MQRNIRTNALKRVDKVGDRVLDRLAQTKNEKASTGWALLPMQSEYIAKDRGEDNKKDKVHFQTVYMFDEGEDLAERAEQRLGTHQVDERATAVVRYRGGKWVDADEQQLDSSEAGELSFAITERKKALEARQKKLQIERDNVKEEGTDPAKLEELIQRLDRLAPKLQFAAIKSHHSVTGRYIFAMNAAGEFFAAPSWAWVIHHSSFMAGGAVACAGEVGIENGNLTTISNQSGHYLPGPAYLWQAVKQLEMLGCPIGLMEVTVMGGKRFRNARIFLDAMDPSTDARWFDAGWAIEQLSTVDKGVRETKRSQPNEDEEHAPKLGEEPGRRRPRGADAPMANVSEGEDQ